MTSPSNGHAMFEVGTETTSVSAESLLHVMARPYIVAAARIVASKERLAACKAGATIVLIFLIVCELGLQTISSSNEKMIQKFCCIVAILSQVLMAATKVSCQSRHGGVAEEYPPTAE